MVGWSVGWPVSWLEKVYTCITNTTSSTGTLDEPQVYMFPMYFLCCWFYSLQSYALLNLSDIDEYRLEYLLSSVTVLGQRKPLTTYVYHSW